tara:strand:- start:1598 stop:1771 length:174 start_codon:yes stop_codon:yes gene_type:complete
MTDYTKYRNVSLSHETYQKLIILSESIVPDVKLSISKTVETITKEKLRDGQKGEGNE